MRTVARDRYAALAAIPAVQRALAAATTMPDLYAAACDALLDPGGFERAVALDVRGGCLVAESLPALAHAPSDLLRRSTLIRTVPITARSAESRVVADPYGAVVAAGDADSGLAVRLGLECFVLAAVSPSGRTQAVLVADRAGGGVGTVERAYVAAVAAMLTSACERAVLRMRLEQLASEVQQMSVATQALIAELVHRPIDVELADRSPVAVPLFSSVEAAAGASRRAQLSEREHVIAALLADGLSNRAIAERLVLSPETVKSHVGRILRKLNASNRAEAAARYVDRSEA